MRDYNFIHFLEQFCSRKIRGILILFIMVLYSTLVGSEVTAEPTRSTFYISPDGSNSNPGTVDKPWKTFDFAIPKLRPGNTLIAKDGIYTKSTTGMPIINCSSTGNVYKGQPGKPITIKAENERQAFLSSDGSQAALEMDNCSYWNIEGLRGQSADLQKKRGGKQKSIFSFNDVSNVNIKKVLATHTNRYFNTQAIAIVRSSDVLIEESEAYYFHRWGIQAFKSKDITFRRNYVNSRDYADITNGRKSIRRNTGDFGMGGYPTLGTDNILIENCISEDSGGGFQAGKNSNSGVFTKVLGSIAIGGNTGLQSETKDSVGSYNVLVENFVSMGNANGIRNRATDNFIVKNATAYNNTLGLSADKPKTKGNVRTYSTNILSFKNSEAGIQTNDQSDWRAEYSNSYSNRVNYFSRKNVSDASGFFKNSMSVEPTRMGLRQGQCIVYVPSTSNMKGAGKDGADIGANIIYRYENGVLTSKKLWDQSTGQFPCGATVKGINDDATFPTSSCINVHKRLNVGVNGCSIP